MFGQVMGSIFSTVKEKLADHGLAILLGKINSNSSSEDLERNVKSLWNLLDDDQMSSIGVHGMGGVGKSTLVDHVNNKLLQRDECVFWVVVSQGCTIKVLQDKISHKLSMNLSDEDDEGARAGRLHHALSQRNKFVLILDDVWDHIDLVKVGLPLSLQCCKWMITSRSLKVCQEMNCQAKISVNPLSEDEGWNLFLKNLGQDSTLALGDPEVERIAKRTVKVCNGLPLGIITLAGAMSGTTEIQEWRHGLRVLKESAMGHEWMEEKVFKVLKYSFDRLNPKDQHCFLYCSLYPEDCRIPREELLCRFMSGDLVDTTKSMTAQRDEGHSILTRLVKVSLLESVSDKYWGECVKMHDLVRAMTLKITKGKTMVITGQNSRKKEILIEEEWAMDLERVSLMMNSIEEIPCGVSPNCPKLSTLHLGHNSYREGIAPSFFSQMSGLCTLDLSNTDIEELPNSIPDLVNLTSLVLKGCHKLRCVPCLRKLKALRELDLSSCFLLMDIPEGLEELLNLKCLSIEGGPPFPSSRLELKSLWLLLLRLPGSTQVELVESSWERLEVFEGRLKDMSDFSRLAASKQGRLTYNIVVSEHKDSFLSDRNIGFGKRKLSVSSYNLRDREGSEFTILAEYIQHLEFFLCQGLGKCLLDKLSNPSPSTSYKFNFLKT